MSAIYNALIRLSDTVQNLEATAEAQEGKIRKALTKRPKAGGQPDLFSIPSAANLSSVDTQSLASKLDVAIARVEQVLREA